MLYKLGATTIKKSMQRLLMAFRPWLVSPRAGPPGASPPPAAPQKGSNVPARSIGTEGASGLGHPPRPNASSDQRRPGDRLQSRAAATMAAIRFGARAVGQP